MAGLIGHGRLEDIKMNPVLSLASSAVSFLEERLQSVQNGVQTERMLPTFEDLLGQSSPHTNFEFRKGMDRWLSVTRWRRWL